jgi:hypothetical protein
MAARNVQRLGWTLWSLCALWALWALDAVGAVCAVCAVGAVGAVGAVCAVGARRSVAVRSHAPGQTQEMARKATQSDGRAGLTLWRGNCCGRR